MTAEEKLKNRCFCLKCGVWFDAFGLDQHCHSFTFWELGGKDYQINIMPKFTWKYLLFGI